MPEFLCHPPPSFLTLKPTAKFPLPHKVSCCLVLPTPISQLNLNSAGCSPIKGIALFESILFPLVLLFSACFQKWLKRFHGAFAASKFCVLYKFTRLCMETLLADLTESNDFQTLTIKSTMSSAVAFPHTLLPLYAHFRSLLQIALQLGGDQLPASCAEHGSGTPDSSRLA